MSRQIAPTAHIYGGEYGGDAARYVPAHALWGEPASRGLAPSHIAGREVVAAQPDGIKYEGDEEWTRCMANNATCKAFRKKGSMYCTGHARSLEKVESESA